MMRHLGIGFVACLAAACTVGGGDPAGGDDSSGDDSSGDDTSGTPDGPPSSANCLVPPSTGDLGTLTPLATEIHNQQGSMGALKTYVIAGENAGDVFQIELWDQAGAFAGGAAAVGSYTIAGADADYNTCGVCGLAIGDETQFYVGTSGTVNVTALGGPGATMTVEVTNLAFAEVDAETFAVVPGGCTGTLGRISLSGTLVEVSGGGGGGGGGGGARQLHR